MMAKKRGERQTTPIRCEGVSRASRMIESRAGATATWQDAVGDLGVARLEVLDVGRSGQDEVELGQPPAQGGILEDVVEEELGHVDVGQEEDLLLVDLQGLGVAVDGGHGQVAQGLLARQQAEVEEGLDLLVGELHAGRARR